jgi:alanyl-tRNA synthetase
MRISDDDIPVVFVGYHEGDVRHYVPNEFFKDAYIGENASLAVDRIHRLDNARLHTGGHLISHVFETMSDKLVPIKGYHFPNGSYVEFVNDWNIDAAALMGDANNKLAEDVAGSLHVSAKLSDFEAITRIRPALAPFTPIDKPSRIVTIGDYTSLPCGGTHVGNLTQLGSIKVTKVKRQKSNVRVSYEMGESAK